MSLVFWGAEKCKRCADMKAKASALNIPSTSALYTEEAMRALWNQGEKARANDLYGMAQWQNNELPIIEQNGIAITWDEFNEVLSNATA
jgi:hypothetical protein